MDNLTHSLVGIALADLVSTERPADRTRQIFVGAGVLAANAPDLDVIYTGITPQPLGYLLHHRGHTHTILGLFALGAGIALLYRLMPAKYRPTNADRARLWTLITAGLVSHVLLDAFNSYGVHPFYPFDSRWYYGDAIFIFEPWIWMLLGVAVAWNARSRTGRLTTVAFTGGLTVLMTAVGVVPPESLVALAVAGGAFAWIARGMARRVRAASAFVATTVMLSAMCMVSSSAREAVRTSLQSEIRGELIDVILTPHPASPLCWEVIGIEKRTETDEVVSWRGTLSLAPGWKAPGDCTFFRVARPVESRVIGSGRLLLGIEVRQSLHALRDVYRQDCWASAWLQFGRAPALQGQRLTDLRFDQRIGENFTTLVLKSGPEAARCPPNLTNWGVPRADLLSDAR